MVDIKEMMRTYVFLNDPNVKQVTTRFGAVVLVLGGIAGATWLLAGASDDVDAEPEASASAYEKTSCMHESEWPSWATEHAPVIDAGTYEVYDAPEDEICVNYTPPDAG